MTKKKEIHTQNNHTNPAKITKENINTITHLRTFFSLLQNQQRNNQKTNIKTTFIKPQIKKFFVQICNKTKKTDTVVLICLFYKT